MPSAPQFWHQECLPSIVLGVTRGAGAPYRPQVIGAAVAAAAAALQPQSQLQLSLNPHRPLPQIGLGLQSAAALSVGQDSKDTDGGQELGATTNYDDDEFDEDVEDENVEDDT